MRLLLILWFALFTANVQAQMFQTVTADEATLVQTGEAQLFCPSCGMNLVTFFKTTYAQDLNGQIKQFCSMHCLVEAGDPDHAIVQAVDANSLQLIDAETAWYVVGSQKRGTMSMTSKYAFASKDEAKAFSKEFGGSVKSYKKSLKIAQEGLEDENVFIDGNRAKIAEKGSKIYEKMCEHDTPPHFSSIGEAKTWLLENKICSSLKEAQIQAVAIHLARAQSATPSAHRIEVPAKAKCPVCGMFTSKYPKWTARIELKQGEYLYFDGVKDLMKFSFDPQRYAKKVASSDIINYLVTDYYSLEALKAQDAWYVAGSNIFGPMGHELIPFKTKEDAEVFLRDHYGKQLLTWSDINLDLIHGLDE
jgi:copper chaperone NosL